MSKLATNLLGRMAYTKKQRAQLMSPPKREIVAVVAVDGGLMVTLCDDNGEMETVPEKDLVCVMARRW